MTDPLGRTPVSDAALSLWPEFLERVERRLEAGRAQYGDSSFTRPCDEIAGEVEEELMDVVGWGFILWCRLQALRERLPEGGR